MVDTPSYSDLRDREATWMELKPYKGVLVEDISAHAEDDEAISSIIFNAKISDKEESLVFPFDDVRIEIPMIQPAAKKPKNRKYPAGHFKFSDEGSIILLPAKADIFSRMVSCMSLVRNGEVTIFVSFPVLPKALPNLYPVNEYQFRVCVTA